MELRLNNTPWLVDESRGRRPQRRVVDKHGGQICRLRVYDPNSAKHAQAIAALPSFVDALRKISQLSGPNAIQTARKLARDALSA